MSGKFLLAQRMLTMLRTTTSDRIVIVSCYTQTLDLFQALCREKVRGVPGKGGPDGGERSALTPQ